MIRKNNNKVLSILNLLEVQQKFFGFDDFDHKTRKRAVRKNSNKSNEIQSKLDVGDYNDPKIILSEEYDSKYYIDEHDIVGNINPICPYCNSRNIIKWSSYSKNIISENYCGEIFFRRYKCKRCNKTFLTDITDQFDSHSNISNSLKEKSCEIKELNWSSLRDISKYYEIFYDLEISHETVRKALIVIEGNEIDYNLPKLSGYYGYDAQWLKINKEWKFRHAIYDIIQGMPVAELFAEKESNKDVYYLINKYTEHKDRIAIVTDTKKGYDSVMRKLKFQRHQYCVFHFKYNLNTKIREEINKRKRILSEQLKTTYPNKSNKFIEDKIEEELKPFKKEIRYALQLTYYVFKEESFDKATTYVELIRANMINFPYFIREYIEEAFLPHYKSYLYYLEEPYKDKLDDTNNKTEGYFRATMPKGQKRKYRTFEGVINQIYHKGNGLIKNQIEKNEKKKK